MRNPIATFRALRRPCWCGAAAGERCRDRWGKPSIAHRTRGKLSRVQAEALAKITGLPLPERPK